MSVTVARPYARAIFDLATSTPRAVNPWLNSLKVVSSSFEDENVKDLLTNPHYSKGDVAIFLQDLIKKAAKSAKSSTKRSSKGGCPATEFDNEIVKHIENFLRLLAENNRLTLIPEICKQFEQMKKESEATIDVDATSAFELSEEQKEMLSKALSLKFGKNINLNTSVDPELIGGVLLRIGDQVIDASVKCSLESMRLSLK